MKKRGKSHNTTTRKEKYRLMGGGKNSLKVEGKRVGFPPLIILMSRGETEGRERGKDDLGYLPEN